MPSRYSHRPSGGGRARQVILLLVTDDDVREALEDCARDAADDAGKPEDAGTLVEPAIPLTHSFETSVDPVADRLSDRFAAWRAARTARRNGP